jgi:hypothetical protein
MKLFARKNRKSAWSFFTRLAYLSNGIKTPSYFTGSAE